MNLVQIVQQRRLRYFGQVSYVEEYTASDQLADQGSGGQTTSKKTVPNWACHWWTQFIWPWTGDTGETIWAGGVRVAYDPRLCELRMLHITHPINSSNY